MAVVTNECCRHHKTTTKYHDVIGYYIVGYDIIGYDVMKWPPPMLTSPLLTKWRPLWDLMRRHWKMLTSPAEFVTSPAEMVGLGNIIYYFLSRQSSGIKDINLKKQTSCVQPSGKWRTVLSESDCVCEGCMGSRVPTWWSSAPGWVEKCHPPPPLPPSTTSYFFFSPKVPPPEK